MSKKPSMNDDVKGWMGSSASDRVADYAARGRKHRGLTDEALASKWVSAFRHMAEDVRDYDRRAVEEDFTSELLLRKIEPPYDLVSEEFERFIAETDRAIKELKIEDPLRFEEIGEEIDRELESFKSTRDRTKN
jgi:hypothetical protein